MTIAVRISPKSHTTRSGIVVSGLSSKPHFAVWTSVAPCWPVSIRVISVSTVCPTGYIDNDIRSGPRFECCTLFSQWRGACRARYPANRQNSESLPAHLPTPQETADTSWRTQSEYATARKMDEGRKRTIGIIAAILAARRLAALGDRPSPPIDATIADCIATAERILRKVHNLHPSRPA
jgi:hypothetical protein